MKIYVSNLINILFLLLSLIFITSCVSVPEGLTTVENFKVQKYLGKWYEIARLDHSFERGLSNVTATYRLQKDDDGLDVLNRGFNSEENEWSEAKGVAYFVDDTTRGELKVSFFRPFYGGYNIIALDTNQYNYSMVAGPDRDYLWILARTPNMQKNKLDSLVALANGYGFDTDKLIFVKHDKKN